MSATNNNWTGVELSGKVCQGIVGTHIPWEASNSSRIWIMHLAVSITSHGCNDWEMHIGYWVTTGEWQFRVEVQKPILPDQSTYWIEPIREYFRGYATRGGVRKRSVQDENFADWRDWFELEEGEPKWKHFTKVSIYRGTPFFESEDGKRNAKDIRDLAELKVRDLQVNCPGVHSVGARSAKVNADRRAFINKLIGPH
ncbi:hypothetical protein BDV06DRAFT_225558 [Aspergillus oleicola]